MPHRAKYSERELAAILNRLLDGIVIIGKEGRIKYVNSSAAALFKMSARHLVGEEFGYAVIAGRVQEIQIIQEQRILYVQMLPSTIEWDGEEAMLISLKNVTEEKKRELDLQMERQKLEQSNLELSQYASMASHDLREPVRKLLTFSKRLIDKFTEHLSPEALGLVEKIHKSAGRLSAIIDGVSKFSSIKNTGLELGTVNVNELIQQIIEDIEILIVEKKVSVRVGQLPAVKGDPSLLYQLFLNLLTNAIKYSKPGVSPVITVTGKIQGHAVIIEFEDNGIGFENRFAEKIFEPFERLITEGYDGTGIGLAICKRIVDAHQGTIRAVSRPELGTKFTIELPQEGLDSPLI